jgi:DtxR family Mn-dependent transcriptional regulator
LRHFWLSRAGVCSFLPQRPKLDIHARAHYFEGMQEHTPLTESLEDYLEEIYVLEKKNGSARVKDIAAALHVRYPSVTSALQALTKRGLVNYEPYGLVTLTDEGRIEAVRVTQKHRLLKSFLINVLGLPADIADENACHMEHAISKDVHFRLQQFLKYLHISGCIDADWIVDFQNFCAKDKAAARQKNDLDAYFADSGFSLLPKDE